MDVDLILEVLASYNLVRLNKPIGDWYSVYCPFHSDGNERKPSCGVSRVKQVRNGSIFDAGVWHCFACGEVKSMKEAVDFILKQNSINSQTAIEWLTEHVPGFNFEVSDFDYLLSRDTVKDLNSKFAMNYIKSLTQPKSEYVSEEELAQYRFTVQYMYDRKLTDQVISKFDVGVDLKYVPTNRKKPVPCITFPVRDKQGCTLFIYRRAIESKNFYMPAGLEKPIYGLYELPENVNTLIICESIINALTCYVYGYPAIALFGTGTTTQLSQLKLLGVKEFVLGLDADEAGDRGCRKLKHALKSIAIVRRMQIPENKDINDLSYEEFIEAYDSRI